MLLQQQEIQLSAYYDLYDLIVPKDNLLRKINELIDFTFIYDELVNKYCSNNAMGVMQKGLSVCLNICC